MTMTLIETVELASTQASITFSSIPQDFSELVILVSARSDASNTLDTISDIDARGFRLMGDGTNVTMAYSGNQYLRINGGTSTTNVFGNAQIHIANYTASGEFKPMVIQAVTENDANQAYAMLFTAKTVDTDPITSFTLDAGNGDLVAGTTASLYGIATGSDGTTTVS